MLSSDEVAWLKMKFSAVVTNFINTHAGRGSTGTYILTQEEYRLGAFEGKTVTRRKLGEVVKFFEIMDCEAKLKSGCPGMEVEFRFDIDTLRLTSVQHQLLASLKSRQKTMKNLCSAFMNTRINCL